MKDYIDYIIEESINKILLTEMGMDATKFADKYGEILDVLVDNLVSITMYPNSQAVPHWRQRVGALVKRFINLDINPKHRNKENYRLALLQSAVTETLNSDYSAIKNHYKSISAYYARPNNPNGILTPYAPYSVCYDEQKDSIINAVNKISDFVAKQDYESLLAFMEDF